MSEPIFLLGSADPIAIVKTPEEVLESRANAHLTTGFERSYNSFSGVDIRVHADGLVLGTVQAIEWDIDFRSGLVTGWMRFIRFDEKEGFTPVKWSKKPFNLRLTAANEYGAGMWMQIGSVKFLTCHGGTSIDDLVIEENATFEAPFSEFTEWTPYEEQTHKIQKIESALADVHFYLDRLKATRKEFTSELPPNP